MSLSPPGGHSPTSHSGGGDHPVGPWSQLLPARAEMPRLTGHLAVWGYPKPQLPPWSLGISPCRLSCSTPSGSSTRALLFQSGSATDRGLTEMYCLTAGSPNSGCGQGWVPLKVLEGSVQADPGFWERLGSWQHPPKLHMAFSPCVRLCPGLPFL